MMKILMIAPEPFFEPRGTPFSEYFRIKSLSRLGNHIDLVTYPVGENKNIENLRIFRSFGSIFVKSVKTGPSPIKLFLDLFLFFRAFRRILFHKYDLIHTHEEANIMGATLSKIFGVPHLYDMHSSLVQQMENFKFSKSSIIKGIFRNIEKISLNNARSVIVICKSLFDYAAKITDKNKLTIIENFIDDSPEKLKKDLLEKIKSEIKKKGEIVITYTGTLETYQGIPMLLESFANLDKRFKLILIGGKKSQIENIRERSFNLGISDRVLLLGRKEPDEIPYYLESSDILVSPRILGTNIPLKVYSFLKSGKPLVATDLYTHTQTLTPEISILCKPEPKEFAEGIKIASGQKGKKIAKQAREFCNKNYSLERYDKLVNDALKKAVNF